MFLQALQIAAEVCGALGVVALLHSYRRVARIQGYEKAAAAQGLTIAAQDDTIKALESRQDIYDRNRADDQRTISEFKAQIHFHAAAIAARDLEIVKLQSAITSQGEEKDRTIAEMAVQIAELQSKLAHAEEEIATLKAQQGVPDSTQP